MIIKTVSVQKWTLKKAEVTLGLTLTWCKKKLRNYKLLNSVFLLWEMRKTDRLTRGWATSLVFQMGFSCPSNLCQHAQQWTRCFIRPFCPAERSLMVIRWATCVVPHSPTKLLQLGYQPDQALCHLRGWVSSLQPTVSLYHYWSLEALPALLLSFPHPADGDQRWPTLVLSVGNKGWTYLRDVFVSVR